jgi:REP element-mobilizing transposase RayT
MPQSLARNLLHLIFSTKNREPLLADASRERMHAYIAGILNNMECHAIRVGGVADHVHALFVLSKNVALVKVVEEVKKQSSKWAKQHVHRRFFWQTGYGAFSVSPSLEDVVAAYIETQESHHRKQSFQDEFREFLRKHRIEWDERYLWD